MKASLLTSAAVADDGGEGEGSDAMPGEVIILVCLALLLGFSPTTDHCFPLWVSTFPLCLLGRLTHAHKKVCCSLACPFAKNL